MKEKRRFIRVYTDIPMSYKHLGTDEEARTSTLVNLSYMGLCFLCEEDLAIGDMLSLDFQLVPMPEIISASAEVIWADHLREKDKSIYEVGVEFVDTDYEDQSAILQFVQYERIAERARRIKKYFVK